MDEADFSNLDVNKGAAEAQKLPAEQLASRACDLSAEQASRLTSLLLPSSDDGWQDKLRSLVTGVEKPQVFEAIGRSLTAPQLLEILDQAADHDKPLRRHLEAIFVGFPPKLFPLVLREASLKQMRILQNLGASESVQHHLTLLLHELSHQADQVAAGLVEVEKQIDQYDLSDGVRQRDIDAIIDQIEQALDYFHAAFYDIDLALKIAWNTHRHDLIDRFTVLKENWLHYLTSYVGHAADPSGPATALYRKLEKKMNSIFHKEGDESGSRGLENDDPSIEGLTALDIWYAQDYWELGLLPAIASADQLALDPDLHGESERATYKKKLLVTAQGNLDKIGLPTVASLKYAHIYSRRILARYVEAHKGVLQPSHAVLDDQ